jgi:hypothetical protein
MKLSAIQTRRVQDQMQAEPIPERHAVTPDLQRAFGDHTFFLNADGLAIVESSPEDERIGNVVKVARWADRSHTMLQIQAPQPTPLKVELAGEEEDGDIHP